MIAKKKFEVTHYYAVVVEISADSADEAMESAGFGETNYDVTATFTEQSGGPRVDRSAWTPGNEVKEVGNDSKKGS